MNPADLVYQNGLGNEVSSEVRPGLLPVGRNSPQKPNGGLVTEQISGTAFTALPGDNRRTWLYKEHPSVVEGQFGKCDFSFFKSAGVDKGYPETEALRWGDLKRLGPESSYLNSIKTLCFGGNVCEQKGIAVHSYHFSGDDQTAFMNADGEMLFVPQQGGLYIETELGDLAVEPTEIAVVPKGIKFRLKRIADEAFGYICENYGDVMRLPYRGPIGASGLANARDFLIPRLDSKKHSLTPPKTHLIRKYAGSFFRTVSEVSVFDVKAWHGNHYPYKYSLASFNTIGSISYDHPDPSIFTVLHSPSYLTGVANLDFVVFGPRWLVMEDTFRPPWYHRNAMSEFMGLICGAYDAKSGDGFVPGGASLHNPMTAHGPDRDAYLKATQKTLTPEKLDKSYAFMFETRYPLLLTEFAINHPTKDKKYVDCWAGL